MRGEVRGYLVGSDTGQSPSFKVSLSSEEGQGFLCSVGSFWSWRGGMGGGWVVVGRGFVAVSWGDFMRFVFLAFLSECRLIL